MSMRKTIDDATVLSLLAIDRRGLPAGMEMHERIRRGFPRASLARVGRAVGASNAEFAGLLGIHARTLSRLEHGAAPRLDPAVSDRLFRVATVIGRATEVMESADGAKRWLRAPQYGLGGAVPFSLLTTDAGTQEVMQLLGRIEHGILD